MGIFWQSSISWKRGRSSGRVVQSRPRGFKDVVKPKNQELKISLNFALIGVANIYDFTLKHFGHKEANFGAKWMSHKNTKIREKIDQVYRVLIPNVNLSNIGLDLFMKQASRYYFFIEVVVINLADCLLYFLKSLTHRVHTWSFPYRYYLGLVTKL